MNQSVEVASSNVVRPQDCMRHPRDRAVYGAESGRIGGRSRGKLHKEPTRPAAASPTTTLSSSRDQEAAVTRAPAFSWMGRRGELYVVAQLALVALVLFGSTGRSLLPAWPQGVATIAATIGVGLIVVGVALAATGILSLGSNITAVPRPKPGATLVERGPYRFVRHPMYAGACLAAFGWAFAVQGWLTLLYATLLLVFFDVKARREERWLREELPGYGDYARRVRRLIPFLY